MANAREILDRMKSIQDTMKITNAMYDGHEFVICILHDILLQAEKGKGKSG